MLIIVVCILVAVGDWIRSFSIEALVAFVGTIVATFAGVGLAAYLNVRQFYYEGEKQDKERSQQLGQSLAGELCTVLDILSGPPNVYIADPTGGTDHLSIVFAQLEPTATEEAIKVGLLGAQSTANLSQLSNLMRDYSEASGNLYPIVSEWRKYPENLAIWRSAYETAKEVFRLRANLIIWCTTVLDGLAAQGVEVPDDPKYRSDPTRVQHYSMGSSTP